MSRPITVLIPTLDESISEKLGSSGIFTKSALIKIFNGIAGTLILLNLK